jgi:Protein of unknown function (DUF3667)
LSHLKEREKRNCLNCNAQVQGKYCHICGQENVEPAESVWHLVTHFFNDITHFDGKFFSTLGLLISRPGFLSAEYKMGRRANYLNPVKMYVFTSFIFFFVFFSLYDPNKDMIQTTVTVESVAELKEMQEDTYKDFKDGLEEMEPDDFKRIVKKLQQPLSSSRVDILQFADSVRASSPATKKLQLKKIAGLGTEELARFNAIIESMDSTQFAAFSRALNDDSLMTLSQYRHFIDSARQSKFSFVALGAKYKNRQEYDSLTAVGLVKDRWLMRKFRQKEFEIKDKYAAHESELWSKIFDILMHNFPQLLFISLPLFALLLKLLYIRRKEFYLVSHGIYSVHLYIFYFIVLLMLIFLNKAESYTHWSWLDTAGGFLMISTFFYEYKAMRNFYGQSRKLTIFKFFLVLFFRLLILLTLLILFFFLSILKV